MLINSYFLTATEIECCCFLSEVVQYWDQEYNSANITLFSANQMADISYMAKQQTCGETFTIRKEIAANVS